MRIHIIHINKYLHIFIIDFIKFKLVEFRHIRQTHQDYSLTKSFGSRTNTCLCRRDNPQRKHFVIAAMVRAPLSSKPVPAMCNTKLKLIDICFVLVNANFDELTLTLSEVIIMINDNIGARISRIIHRLYSCIWHSSDLFRLPAVTKTRIPSDCFDFSFF